MRAFNTLNAVAAPLMRADVNTDLIIRIERLVGNNTRGNLGPWCFEMLRYNKDGSENPDCVFNKEPYRHAEIILATENFGCGSSREGAVWALQDMGINCVIAESFGDIFYNNCFQIGVLPIPLPLDQILSLANEVETTQGAGKLTIDLDACVVIAPSGARYGFEVEARRRHALMNGLDEIGVTSQRFEQIDAFVANDMKSRPWIYQIGEQK